MAKLPAFGTSIYGLRLRPLLTSASAGPARDVERPPDCRPRRLRHRGCRARADPRPHRGQATRSAVALNIRSASRVAIWMRIVLVVALVAACGAAPATTTTAPPSPPAAPAPAPPPPPCTTTACLADACERGELASCDPAVRGLTAAHVRADRRRAVHLHELGCARDSTASCNALADALEAGAYIDKDMVRAAALRTKLCEQRVGDACWRLGHQVLNGDGVHLDEDRADRLLDQACEAGSAEGCAW